MKTEIDYEQLSILIEGETISSKLQEYQVMQQLYNSAIREVKTKLEILNDEFAVKHDHNPIHSIEARLKSIRSIANKLRNKNLAVSFESARENLYDIAGVRVICCYIDDIYSVAKMLLGQNDVTLIEIKDYIKSPKANGYRSLHLIISIPIFLSTGAVEIPIEIQLRTVAMDFWASLEHELRYKTNCNIPERANAELLECAETIAKLDTKMQDLFREVHNMDNQ